MVEVIYTCKEGKYPFGRGKQTQQTYMQYLLQAKHESQVNRHRQLNSIIKKLTNPNIIRLIKVLKEDMSFHMIYEFHNKSLEQRLNQLENEEQLTNIFLELENVFDTLVQQKLKAQLYLEFMGVDQHNHLKVWIKPDELQYLGNTGEPAKKLRKFLLDYYETQRTRIHLEIQEIFQSSELHNLKKNTQKRHSEKEKHSGNTNQSIKGKTPNFVIEGNTLVFLNKSSDKLKHNTSEDTQQNQTQKNLMSKVNHLIYEQRPVSKGQNLKETQKNPKEVPDLSKMSVAQKVLYYKKQRQNTNQLQSSHEGQLIVKDSSTSNVSQNDISKSSNNDSNLQIKKQMINKHKMKITTSQQVEVEGNSDDDLEKLARQKISKINKERHQKSKNNDNSMETGTKANTSGHSGDVQKLLKGLEDNSVEQKDQQKQEQHSKQINNKIAQAKLKARNILDKYGQKLKK